MYPIIFSIGRITIYSYGVMMALSLLSVTLLISRRAYIFNISKDFISSLVIVVFIFGIIGARLLYVLSNFDYFSTRPFEVFFINRGGLVYYGGFLLGITAAVFYSKIKKVSLMDVADLSAPFIAFGHSIGRIGCFLNGCCYGKVISPFLKQIWPFNNFILFPTQLISSFSLFLIFILLFLRQNKRLFKGEIFLLYLIIYGIFRFLIEFIRGDSLPLFGLMTEAQLISLFLILFGIVFYLFGKRDQVR